MSARIDGRGRTRGAQLGGAGILALLIVLLAAPVQASSQYSLRGEGEPTLPSRADTRALGGAEAARSVPALTGNPASLVFTDRARFWGSWNTDWTRTEETLPSGHVVAKGYSGLVPNLALVFPLPREWAMGIGLVVDRRADGLIERRTTTPDGRPYTQSLEVAGNHLRIPILLAHDPGPVQIGAGVDVLLRNGTERWRNTFDNDSLFVDTNDVDKFGLWGAALRIGARVPIGSRLAAGAWFSQPSDLSGTRRLENDDNDDSDDLKVDAEAELPRRFGSGLAWTPDARFSFAADWTRETWSDIGSEGTAFQDVDRLSVGASWSRGERWPLRMGYRTENLHVLDGNGDEIREHAVSVGTGFGFAGGRGEMDGFLEYVWRGVADESEYYEQVVRIGVTLTGFEEWSRRRRPEGEEDF